MTEVPMDREQALQERERAVQLREMRLRARSQLRERGLPETLAEALNYQDDGTLERSMQATEQAFRLAVERSVLEKMRGSAPQRAAPRKDPEELSDDEYYRSILKK